MIIVQLTLLDIITIGKKSTLYKKKCGDKKIETEAKGNEKRAKTSGD